MDALESLPLESLQTMLAEAIAARHRLLTGPSSASAHNRTIAYQQQLRDADAYISRLNSAIQAKSGTSRRGPIYMV